MYLKEGTPESASCGGAPKCPSLWVVTFPSPWTFPTPLLLSVYPQASAVHCRDEAGGTSGEIGQEGGKGSGQGP